MSNESTHQEKQFKHISRGRDKGPAIYKSVPRAGGDYIEPLKNFVTRKISLNDFMTRKLAIKNFTTRKFRRYRSIEGCIKKIMTPCIEG